jgi:F-type H+-transporting ATPase subunit b
MKPTAKKGLIVICVLYAVTVGVMIWDFAGEADPRDPARWTAQLQEDLNRIRQEAVEVDPDHFRATAITDKEAEEVLGLLVKKGSIININFTLVMQCLNFAILLLVLYGWLWDPILAFLDERGKVVRNQLKAAEEDRHKAGELLEQRRDELEDLRGERDEILEQARAAGEQQRKDIVEQARREAARVSAQQQERLEESVRRARVALRGEVADLSTQIAGRLLEREIKPDDHQQLIDSMMGEMSEGEAAGAGGER